MKPVFTRMLTLASALILTIPQVFGGQFTASTSGNFSSGATWVGGIAPPSTVGANDIYISSGVTVTLDVNLVLNSSFSLLQIYGTGKIQSTSTNYIAFNAGTVTADAQSSIDVDSIVLGIASLQFSGTVTANGVTLAAPNLPGTITINAKRTLRINPGLSMLNLGTAIVLSNTPTIVVAGGDLQVTPGANFNLAVPYHLRYISGGQNIGNGYELTGTGLGDIEIAPGSGQTINLNADLTVNKTLKLTSGTLALDIFALNLAGTSTIDATGTGNITCNPFSKITITSTAVNLGTLRFAPSSSLGKFTMNAPGPNAIVKLGSSLQVDSFIDLQNGHINVQGNTLKLMQTSGVLQGGSANSYIITETGGMFKQEIQTNASATFHVGHNAAYAPVTIAAKNGTTYPEMGINVSTGVKAQGATGADISSVEPLVNTTWTTSHIGNPTIDYDVEPMWSASMEVNNFDRNNSYVAYYAGAKWNKGTPTAATSSGSMYSSKKEGAKSFGQFTIFDYKTLGIADITTGNIISLYPNPATTTLSFNLKSFEKVQATIYNATGQAISTATLNVTNNTINIAQLPQGMYYVQLHGSNFSGTAKFVKQ